MKSKTGQKTIRINAYIWHVAAMVGASALVYYLPNIVGLAGWASQQDMLNKFHNFYGIDLYSLVFFIPAIYAAYMLGTMGAIATALICMLALMPYAIWIDPFPSIFFKPTAFTIILAAVSTVVAMLQKGDEQRHRSMKELKCLYDIGKAVEEGNGVERFLSSVVALIPQIEQHPEETKVRITIRDKVVEGPNFAELANSVREDLLAGGETPGSIEVFTARSSPYLSKQNHWLKTLAERIGGAIREIELEQSLQDYYTQLEDMVENRTRDLQQAQEQLRLLSNTVKSSIDGITLTDMAGKLTFANEAGQKMWGYDSEEVTEMRLSHLYSADELDLIDNNVIPWSRGGVWHGELTAQKKDGSQFPVFVTTSPVRDEAGQTIAIVGVHRNITETKEMREKLIRTERLAAVGELASGVGHELRNPLNVIRNCAYLLRASQADESNEELLNTLKILDRQVDIANRIITDLLDFTRVKPPLLAKTDLNKMVKESLSWIVVPEKIAVLVDLDADSPQIAVDAEQMGRAFVNIIANSVQSMSGGGKLKISTGLEDGSVWVKFEDTGCGIPRENMAKIFDPLFTTKAKGTGLGLAITKRMVEQNSGTIEVTSEVAQGTIFTIRLPLKERST